VAADRDTTTTAYAEHLRTLHAWWRRALNVQAPYAWNLRRLRPGFTLDVGCGIGRNLAHLHGHGVGVDHNPASIHLARQQGFTAYTPDDFRRSEHARRGGFDTLLLAHIVEHMSDEAARDLVAQYVEFVRPRGKLIVICPQERGYRLDSTHVTFTDFSAIEALCEAVSAEVIYQASFPFPRRLGTMFPYNEFVVVARLAP